MKQTTYHIEPHLLQLISSQQAFHYKVVPVGKEGNRLTLLTLASTPDTIISELEIVLDHKIALQRVPVEEFDRYLSSNYRKREHASNRILHYTTDFLEIGRAHV